MTDKEHELLDFATAFGIELRLLRTARQWSHSDAAKAIGIARANYTRIEHGVHSPRVETIVRTAEVFSMEPTDLFQKVLSRARALVRGQDNSETP